MKTAVVYYNVTGTGTFNITAPELSGVVPQAAIFEWLDGYPNVDGINNNNAICEGYAVNGGNQCYIATHGGNAQATSNVGNSWSDSNCFGIPNWAGNNYNTLGAVTAWIADGISLNIKRANQGGGLRITFIYDVVAAWCQFRTLSAWDTTIVTGHRSDILWRKGMNNATGGTTDERPGGPCYHGMAIRKNNKQMAVAFNEQDGAGTANINTFGDNQRFIYGGGHQGSVTAWNADGFTLDITAASNFGQRMIVLSVQVDDALEHDLAYHYSPGGAVDELIPCDYASPAYHMQYGVMAAIDAQGAWEIAGGGGLGALYFAKNDGVNQVLHSVSNEDGPTTTNAHTAHAVEKVLDHQGNLVDLTTYALESGGLRQAWNNPISSASIVLFFGSEGGGLKNIYHGPNQVQDLQFGGVSVSEVYYGGTKVYG